MFLALVMAAASVLVATTAAAATTPQSPWSGGGFNAAFSNDNVAESILTPTSVKSIKKVATIAGSTKGDAPCADKTAGPVEVGGFVYVVTGNAVVKANASTGATVWATILDANGSSSYFDIAISGNTVVVGGDECGSASDPNGVLQAYSTSSGANVWKADMISGFGGAFRSLAISGAYVVAEGSSEGSGAVISAHNLTTGNQVWAHHYASGCSGAFMVVGGVVINSGCNANGATTLYADTLATGAHKWTKAGPWQIDGGDTDASTAKDAYVTNSRGFITDITPQTGAIKGTLPSSAHTVLAVGNSRLFTACTTGICAYSRSTRSLLWSYNDLTVSLTAGVGGTVLYLSDGTVLQSETGALLRHLFSGSHAVVVADGHLYADFGVYR